MALDGRVVRVRVPTDANERVGLPGRHREPRRDAGTPAARVVLNARTGSVVMNERSRWALRRGARQPVGHHQHRRRWSASPTPLSQGQTVVTEKADIRSAAGRGAGPTAAGAKLADVVKALNALGATPQDLLAILQAMKSAGALNAEIEVI
jgi:flagellar P-ring protein precursor FlgI